MPNVVLAVVWALSGWMNPTRPPGGSIDLSHAPVTVLLFVAVDCPISNGYVPEMDRLIARYDPRGVQFVAVYPDPGTTAAQAARHARTFSLHCRTAIDPQHVWACRTGATVTPEAAILSPSGRVLYVGRIDNLYAGFGLKRFAATTHDLQTAIDAAIENHPAPLPGGPPVGCPF